MLITLKIKTCRRCGRSLYTGDNNVTIKPDDEVDIIDMTIVCYDCKVTEARQMKSRRR